MAVSGALDNKLLDLADEIFEEGRADGFAEGLIEGARQALDAQALLAEPEMCPCGCGLTDDEINYLDDAFAEARDEAEGCDCEACSPLSEDTPEPAPDDIVFLTVAEFEELFSRLEVVEAEVGLKYTG